MGAEGGFLIGCVVFWVQVINRDSWDREWGGQVVAVVEWVCTEVGKVGVEVRGADPVDIVAVGVVKRGCDQGPGGWRALQVILE